MKTKVKRRYQCLDCGAETPQYLGRCPNCQAWNTLEEMIDEPDTPSLSYGMATVSAQNATPQRLTDIALNDMTARYATGFPELDRVLGGGLVPGEYVLFGGDPGIGKSTLMLQLAHQLAQQGKVVLYVAGEESPHQIKLRAERLNVKGDRILIYPETNLSRIQAEIKTSRPDIVIVDSIQSVYEPNMTGTPGSVNQIKACASGLMGLAKALDVCVLLVGHVTKEGSVSGPKLLEHTVDAVLYLEGEKYRNLRILRAVKNRFGNTNEIGVFEMTQDGLEEVTNPSELFLSESRYQQQPGSAIVCTMEGNRPLLVEIQALVGLTTYASPRRVANGLELGRVHQVIAVLERRLGLDFSKQDVYINVVGGLKIQEPASDLALALALVSSIRDVSLTPRSVLVGEIGLTGEIRPVGQEDVRVAEAAKLGFETVILPKAGKTETTLTLQGIQPKRVGTLMQALGQALDSSKVFTDDKSIIFENSLERTSS